MNALEFTPALSERALALPASPIRALLNAHRGKETLDLGGGIPDPALFPSEELAAASAHVLVQASTLALQYAPTEGLEPLREWIARRLQRRGLAVQADQILITQGSQQAMASVASVLLSRGDLALLEQPVYPGAMQAFALTEARLGALPVTEDGWDLTAIEGQSPKAAYIIPHHQNPTGRCASRAQSKALAALAEQKGFYLVEDDVYGELDFQGTLTCPVVANCPNHGVLVGSFSKTLCPGLRLGYIATPLPLRDALIKTLQATSLQPGTFTQYLVHELLEHIDYEAHLKRLRACYAERASLLSQRCSELGLSHRSARGGFFLWVRTTADATLTAKHLASQGLLAVPESAFRAPGLAGSDRHLRLAFPRYLDEERAKRTLRIAFTRENIL